MGRAACNGNEEGKEWVPPFLLQYIGHERKIETKREKN